MRYFIERILEINATLCPVNTLVQQPSDYINFLIYCKKRKSFCKGYHQLKKALLNGQIGDRDYVESLHKIHNSVIELELHYFDILYMRL